MTYKEAKEQVYRKYKRIKAVRCPYLKGNVVFNSNGFRHLIYKTGNNKRDEESQIMRFELFEKAVKVIKVTTTLFWSVIPNWRTRQKEKIFFKGDMEKD